MVGEGWKTWAKRRDWQVEEDLIYSKLPLEAPKVSNQVDLKKEEK